ncbi:zinc-binding protein A33, partial [Amia ocellicauda]|uniref:zinc-binding protein A33 n=1 Tax=Amia ocellicauda TaxID=2972642 RepID=UPI003463BCA2
MGVYVDYEEGQVSFYNVEARSNIYTFIGYTFKEKIFPFFSPSLNNGGNNAEPLIISPGNSKFTDFPDLSRKGGIILKSVWNWICEAKVDVTLDPNIAHPNLILSDDGKEVRHGDTQQALPDNPKRFNQVVSILGKEGFTSGKHYWEVEVKNKTAWTLGVARESIKRKGKITTCPENGYWTVRLRNGNEYDGNASPSVSLTLTTNPRRVGVYLDYEEGQVSFYNVEDRSYIYTFTDYTFSEKLFPYFCPCDNNRGINAAPLIISPDSCLDHKGLLYEQLEFKSMCKYAVDVTLDPNTAQPWLILSEDGKQVR